MSEAGAWTRFVLAVVAATALALGVWMARGLDPESIPHPQQSAAAWWLEDLDGLRRTPGEWEGTVVLINFWATWCAPCREEMPLLSRVSDQYRDRGLAVVGLAIDRPDAVRRYRKQLGIPYPLLIVRGDASALLREWGSTAGALPFSLLRDRSGHVLATRTGPYSEVELRQLLEKHLSR